MKEKIDTVSDFEKIKFVKKRRRIIIIISIVVVAVIAFLFIKKSNGSILVESLELSNIKIQRSVSASGKVKSVDDADLAFPGVGRLDYVAVEKGDVVTKGQLIGYISNYDSTKSVESYRNARDVAQSNLDIYIENYQTNLNAVGGKDEYELNVVRLRELLAQAEATYQSSLGTLQNKYLYAPFEGTVVDVYKKKGEIVGVGEAIVKLVDLGNLTFEVEVDQEDFGLLAEGQVVEITLDSYEDIIFSGILEDLPKYADETSEEFEVDISIDPEQAEEVLFGMSGDARVIVEETATEVTALTFDLIYLDAGTNYVWIEDNGVAKKLDVEIGLEGDLYTEIKTDLTDYALIQPEDIDKIHEDVKVKYKPQ